MRGAGVLVLPTLLLAPFVAACGDGADDAAPVRLATTTSTHDAGLLLHLLPPFEEQTGIEVQVVAVGTGRALELGRRGDVDLVLVHAREREDAFVAAGHGIDRRDVMWNDFVIAGPSDDPAGVAGWKDAAKALRRIAERGARFVSRGDDSGTHTRERMLWERAGTQPTWEGYWEAGQGMGPCLTMADEKRAYVLADRGTWLAFRGKTDLEVLVEGDPRLHNPYGAILTNPKRHPHVNVRGARRLVDYLVSPEGQRRIGAFRLEGKVLFHPHGGE